MDIITGSAFGVCSPCVRQSIVGPGDIATPKQYLNELEVHKRDDYFTFARQMYDICKHLDAGWLGGLPSGPDRRIWEVLEDDGNIYRYIEGIHKTSGLQGVWHRANIETSEQGVFSGKWGSIWHLEAAMRELTAERTSKDEDKFKKWQ